MKAGDWRRLWVYVSQLPADSPLVLAVSGQEARWGVAEQVLAGIHDILVVANWQRGGGKGPKPERLIRPGVEPSHVKLGGIGYSPEQLDGLLRRYVGDLN